MKSFDHCEFEHERSAMRELHSELPSHPGIEMYPCFLLFDRSKQAYLECDLVLIGRSFCAIVELKHWRGEISVHRNLWIRNGRDVPDPHKTNTRKCRVLKSVIETELPAIEVPYVFTIVTLTEPSAEVQNADRAKTALKRSKKSDNLTFVGMQELADFIKLKSEADAKDGEYLIPKDHFTRLINRFNDLSEIKKDDYSDQIPGYRVLEVLEHGGSYISYIAEMVPISGRRKYRLRVFGPESDDPQERTRQYRSLKALDKLDTHPNILNVSAHPNERRMIVEVSEWIGANTLRDKISELGAMNYESALPISYGLAKAMAHIHDSESPIIHRNISPQSIYIMSDGTPLLTDFDLVYDPLASFTVMGEPEESAITPYMAPEVFDGKPDLKSDVYSWGVCLYEMLKGEAPVPDFRVLDTQEGKLSEQQMSSLPENVPERIRELISKTIISDVSSRIESSELVSELEEILGKKKDRPIVELQEPALPETGDTIDTWKLKSRIGKGSTAEVFIGDSFGELGLLKLYASDFPRELCVREKEFLRSIESSYIPKYKSFQFSKDFQRFCLIQEFKSGDSLKSFIDRGEPPTKEEFLLVVAQLLQALSDIHQSDADSSESAIIHNDINPNNILYSPDENKCALIDFGAASNPGEVTFRGTKGYIPSHLISGSSIYASVEGDLYSLALTLLEWINGHRPDSVHDIEITTLTPVSAEQASGLSNWFRKALDPVDGYKCANEMACALDSIFKSPAKEVFEIEEEAPEISNDADEVIVQYDEISPQFVGADNFVDYLNSLHNANPANVNALAESQAVSTYFGEIYIPFPFTSEISTFLSEHDDKVIILTGHAGDGKSTIALEVLKNLRGIPVNEPLSSPPDEHEIIKVNSHEVHIIKDMSELSSKGRLEIISNSIEDKNGSWLIVSNTGPLLSAFSNYVEISRDLDISKHEIESKILALLDMPGMRDIGNSHKLDILPKPVLILNLSKFDNVDIVTDVLQKLVMNPHWEKCDGCPAQKKCHILANIKALNSFDAAARQRVGWVYRKAVDYEKRMSMRVMISHLAFSITSGYRCPEVRTRTYAISNELEVAEWIGDKLFSEVFFGMRFDIPASELDSFYCVDLIRRLQLGEIFTPDIDRSILQDQFQDWATIPDHLTQVVNRWIKLGQNKHAIGIRNALKRLLFIFAKVDHKISSFGKTFLDQFISSENLIDLEMWRSSGRIMASNVEKRRLVRQTLSVLLEEYSGFSATQFSNLEKLYITMHRTDHSLFQPTQIVLASFLENDFELIFDTARKMLKLTHKSQGANNGLLLTLPLLDYITRRSKGILERGLSPIFLAQLDYFRAQLLQIYRSQDRDNVITLLRSEINGKVKPLNIELSEGNTKLECL